MERFSNFIRYLAVCLVAVYVLADGHLLCALCHSTCTAEHTEHDCGHSQCPPTEIPSPTHCCSEHPGGQPCDTNTFAAVIVQRKGNESVKPPVVLPIVFDSDAAVEYQKRLTGLRTITSQPSASSVRLHLLYEMLVI